MSGAFAINPGSGPVVGGTVKQATKNIRAFVRELNLGRGNVGFQVWKASREEGRYMFTLNLGRRKCKVEMPGLPLEQVQFLDRGGQNPWHFPRLYVEGSSWLWCFALDMAKFHLTGKDEP